MSLPQAVSDRDWSRTSLPLLIPEPCRSPSEEDSGKGNWGGLSLSFFYPEACDEAVRRTSTMFLSQCPLDIANFLAKSPVCVYVIESSLFWHKKSKTEINL
jgi:hypothetical protein